MDGEKISEICIGVRDSGVGGLTVAKQILRAIPSAKLLYFADTAHVPYGDKTPAQIRHYALSISDFLISQGAQMVVFACNTTSAIAIEAARARFGVPIWGVIEPGAQMATQISRGKIGVLATSATVQSGVYTQTIQKLRPDTEVLEIGCPAFVPLVEAQKADSLEALEACKHYLAPLLRFGADTIVLGCTHYPLLLPHLEKLAPEVRFVDPAVKLAQDLASRCAAAQFSCSPHVSEKSHRFFVSGEQDGVREWIRSELQIEATLELGPVFD